MTDTLKKRLYGIKAIADYLEMQPETIRKWVRYGRIPFRKINGSLRFDIADIDKWIDKLNHKVI